MSYTVKIVDNNSGKVIIDDADVECIIGAASRNDGVHLLAMSSGTLFALCDALNTAEKAIGITETNHPELKTMRCLLKLADESCRKAAADES